MSVLGVAPVHPGDARGRGRGLRCPLLVLLVAAFVLGCALQAVLPVAGVVLVRGAGG